MPVTVWKGQLTFGLISIPIRIFRAAREERIRFRHVYAQRNAAEPSEEKDIPASPSAIATKPGKVHAVPRGNAADARSEPAAPVVITPLRQGFTQEDSGEPVQPRDVLKGYEYSKGEFAVFRPEELRQLRAATTPDMEIVEFIKLAGIDAVYFNASYYVAPDRGGDKPYALLFEAMRRTGFAALARFAMHGRERIAVLRPGASGIILHTLFYPAEIHASDEASADLSLVKPQESKLAEMLIAQLSGEFDPARFTDERMARVRRTVEQRIAGSAGKAAAVRPGAAPVVDILDALRRSLEKKPPAKEPSPNNAQKPRRAGA